MYTKITQLNKSSLTRLEYPSSLKYNFAPSSERRVEFCKKQMQRTCEISIDIESRLNIENRLIELCVPKLEDKEVAEARAPQVSSDELRGRPKTPSVRQLWQSKENAARMQKAGVTTHAEKSIDVNAGSQKAEPYDVLNDPLVQGLNQIMHWWRDRNAELGYNWPIFFFDEVCKKRDGNLMKETGAGLRAYAIFVSSMTDAERITFCDKRIAELGDVGSQEIFIIKNFWMTEKAVAIYNSFLNDLIINALKKNNDISYSELKALDPVIYKELLSLANTQKNNVYKEIFQKLVLSWATGFVVSATIVIKLILEVEATSVQTFWLSLTLAIVIFILSFSVGIRYAYNVKAQGEEAALKAVKMCV